MLVLTATFCVMLSATGAASATYGDLDASFGDGGKVRLSMFLSQESSALRVQADGKILLSTDSGLYRLNRDGSKDKAFAVGSRYGAPHDLELLDDGRIALIDDGRTLTVLNQNGTPDLGFANRGTLTLGIGSTGMRARSIAVQDGSKILVSGSIDDSQSVTSLRRVNSDGSLDPTFGAAGTASIPGRSGGQYPDPKRRGGSAVTVNPAGEILLGFDWGVDEEGPSAGVAKFSHDGARVMNFGNSGIAPVVINGALRYGVMNIVVAETGSFVVLGAGGNFGRGVYSVYTANYLDASGTPVKGSSFQGGTGAAVVPGAGIMLGGFTPLRGDLSPDARFDPSSLAALSIGGCGAWGPIAAYPDGGTVGISVDNGACDSQRRNSHMSIVRVLGPNGGKAAPTVSIKSEVATKYKRGILGLPWLTSVSGLAGPAISVRRVGVAIRRLDSKLLKRGQCRWLTHGGTRSVKTRATKGTCKSPVFMSATGTSTWKFKLRRPLPIGKYRLHVRATLKSGATTSLSPDLDTFRSFKVVKVH